MAKLCDIMRLGQDQLTQLYDRCGRVLQLLDTTPGLRPCEQVRGGLLPRDPGTSRVECSRHASIKHLQSFSNTKYEHQQRTNLRVMRQRTSFPLGIGTKLCSSSLQDEA